MAIIVPIYTQIKYKVCPMLTRRSEFEEYPLVCGDTLPRLDFALTNEDETPYDLTGWNVNFYFRKAGYGEIASNLGHTQCVIDDAVSGSCHYDFQDGDIVSDGTHFGELELSQGDRRVTVPYSFRFMARAPLR